VQSNANLTIERKASPRTDGGGQVRNKIQLYLLL
jgi:hypothetical protein